MATRWEFRWAAVVLGGLALLAGRASAQNLLANPGFEEPITYEGTTFVGSWEGFSGGAGAGAGTASVNPRTGAQHLDLNIVNTDQTFAGVFQDVPVTAGQQLTFSGWNRTPSSPLDLTPEVRIEWVSPSGSVTGRTDNVDPSPGATYGLFSVSGTVPADVSFARVVYAVQTFSGEPTNNGQVFVDDLSLAVVPEPGAAALVGIGLIGLLGRRRRLRLVRPTAMTSI
jgi:hypothetical protein